MGNVLDSKRNVVFISAITSDIGIALAKRYSKDNYIVAGTYRSKEFLPELSGLADCHLFYCDLSDKQTIETSIKQFAALGLPWETFISCAAIPTPLTSFFTSNFDEWSQAIHINAIEQLRVLHSIYPFRNTEVVANVVFFAGPGTNNAVKNFSAAVISKIMLIKMCELLYVENVDLNVFIIGPGWTKTKAHQRILSDPHVSPEKYNETLNFLKSQQGTSMDDIYRCIRWLSSQGKTVAGGRNFSVVHDYWGSEELSRVLLNDSNMYKLRRFRNDWKDKAGKKNDERKTTI
jgi:NAD(P)-dependent dehydrogenase (short-subunit alcohol dehydrogenase family)